MPAPSPIESVMDFLFKPVPFVPEDSVLGRFSFIHRQRDMREVRRRRAVDRHLKSGSKSHGRQITLTGAIQRGKDCQFAICSTDFSITPDTWVFGDVAVGSPATVELIYANGSAYAKKITIG
jgi:hypothetical protein